MHLSGRHGFPCHALKVLLRARASDMLALPMPDGILLSGGTETCCYVSLGAPYALVAAQDVATYGHAYTLDALALILQKVDGGGATCSSSRPHVQ